MGTETGLALRPQGGALEISTLTDVERLATLAVASGLVQVRRAEEAAMLLITGRELGLSPMQSLRGIYVVNGRLVLSADLLVAIVRRSGLCESWQVVTSTAERCTIETKRRGEPTAARKTWTMEDARRASLNGKGTWGSYPAQMLRHRCAADLAREVYPDVVLGLYAPEEFGTEDPSGTPRGASDDQDNAHSSGDDKPEGSRAFAAFVLRVSSLPTVSALLAGYHALVADLREEGHDPAEYLADGADDPAALGAASLVGQRVHALGHRLALIDLTALLTDGGERIAAGLDSQAEAIGARVGVDAHVALVEWWRARRAELAGDKAVAKVLYGALVRRWDGSDEPPDGPRTKRAKGELERALRIADEDAGRASPPAAPQARRVREVLPGTEAEVRAHVGRYGHPRAIENAARKYAPMPALHRALAERLMAVGEDSDGTRLTDRGALLQVEAWSKQEPVATERKAVGR